MNRPYTAEERKANISKAEGYEEILNDAGYCTIFYPESYQINSDDDDGVTQTYCVTTGTMLLRNKQFCKTYHYDTKLSYSIHAFLDVLRNPWLRKMAVAEKSDIPLNDNGIKGKPKKKRRSWF